MKQKMKSDVPETLFTEELLLRAKQKDQGALTALYEATDQDIYRTIHSMVRDEDLVLDIQQDTYLRAFSKLDQLKNAESFPAWIRKIAVNEAKNQLSRKKPLLFSELTDPESDVSEALLPDVSAMPEEILERAETTRLVDDILKTLTPEQHLVVGMYYYEQIPAKQIAEDLGVSTGTVHSQLYWGRKKIEAGVRGLEKQGIKLYELSPITFLLGLLKNSRPAEKANKRVIDEVLRQSAKPAASVGMRIGRNFFETVLGKLVLGVIVVGFVGGGVYAYRVIRDMNLSDPMGNYRPTVTETSPLPNESEQIVPTQKESFLETQTETTPSAEDTVPSPEETTPAETIPKETQPEETTPKDTKPAEPKQDLPQQNSLKPTDPQPETSEPAESETTVATPVPENQERTVLRDFNIPTSMSVGRWDYFEIFVYGESEPTLYTDHPEILYLERKGRFYDNPYGKDGDIINNGVYYGKARDWAWYASALSAGTANLYCVLNGETTLLKTVTVLENEGD